MPLSQERPPRVVIATVAPVVDGGRYAVKRSLGVRVTAKLLVDSGWPIDAQLLYRHEGVGGWRAAPIRPQGNDVWITRFAVVSAPQASTKA